MESARESDDRAADSGGRHRRRDGRPGQQPHSPLIPAASEGSGGTDRRPRRLCVPGTRHCVGCHGAGGRSNARFGGFRGVRRSGRTRSVFRERVRNSRREWIREGSRGSRARLGVCRHSGQQGVLRYNLGTYRVRPCSRGVWIGRIGRVICIIGRARQGIGRGGEGQSQPVRKCAAGNPSRSGRILSEALGCSGQSHCYRVARLHGVMGR